MRPLMPHERGTGDDGSRVEPDLEQAVIGIYDHPQDENLRRDFQFDQVFDPQSR